MVVDLNSNFYELFELPVQFDIDSDALATRFRSLQQTLHPDRHASASAAEKRWSMQAASVVNDGYQTLKAPLRRAVYLLSLNGISTDEETDTRMSPMFLMEQMELRESLEEAPNQADPGEALDAIRIQLKGSVSEAMAEFDAASVKSDWAAGRETVRQWQFLDKLSREVRTLEERLDS